MQIHVARNSAQLGVFSPEDVLAGLSSGRFHASDLAWREGMAAWTPLGDWPEFRGSGVPASPGAPVAEAPTSSIVPWEQGKSLGSFFATLRMAIANPGALASGRFDFGDWLTYCYVGMLFSLPFQLASLLAFGDKNAQVGEFLKSLNIPELNDLAQQMAQAQPAPLVFTLIGAAAGLAFAPLIYAFMGVLHWLGQRVFRFQVPLERTVAVSLLTTAAVVVLTAPLQLLGFSLITQVVVSFVTFVPVCVIYYRALGAATGINPWVQFGVSTFVWLVLCCCCCFLPGMLLWGAAATR
ncbi:MAG: DUF4339 domain-containing protein [Verrucomicrobia bacterium]|nr:DUF4339 domain-containing protein [Verrucomicrobiota bacterium]